MEKKAYDERTKSSMTQRKIDSLNSIGFTWAKRKGDVSWNEKFRELQEYRRVHGNCKISFVFEGRFSLVWISRLLLLLLGEVPTKYPANPALGRWVSTQVRVAEREGLERLHYSRVILTFFDPNHNACITAIQLQGLPKR